MSHNKMCDISICAMAAAILTVCAWISLPVGDIAVTLQTFGLVLILEVLGGQRGTVTCCVYILMGAVGFPVFSGFRGGIGALLGMTGGYIWGFLFTCGIYWVLTRRSMQKSRRILGICLGLLSCYFSGTLWYCAAYAGFSPGSILLVAAKCVLPFLIPDAVKTCCAWGLAGRIRKYVHE